MRLYSYDHYVESADFLHTRVKEVPSICVVLGSGLGVLADQYPVETTIPYQDIPHFPISTVSGHEGALLIVLIENKPVFFMKGRCHFYEGYTMEEITFPYRVLSLLGVRSLLLTNASGGIADSLHPGDLMMLNDHISLFSESPLRGHNISEFGPRFPDQTYVYSPKLKDLLTTTATQMNIPLKKGVYAMLPGPQYETPAEIRALKSLGADAVGMSTVPEAIVASHCSMSVAGLSCITNYASGRTAEPLSHSEVIAVGKSSSEKSALLVDAFIRKFLSDET